MLLCCELEEKRRTLARADVAAFDDASAERVELAKPLRLPSLLRFERLLLLLKERLLLLLGLPLLLLQLLEVLVALLGDLLLELLATRGDVRLLRADLIEQSETLDASIHRRLVAVGTSRLHLALHADDLSLDLRDAVRRFEPLLITSEPCEVELLIDEVVDPLPLVSDRLDLLDFLLKQSLPTCDFSLERLAVEDAVAGLLLCGGDALLQACGCVDASLTELVRLLGETGEVLPGRLERLVEALLESLGRCL